tara:strand:- start:11 stop:499 length:489 start_codon:yes stop_codon:yes gene_type:complete
MVDSITALSIKLTYILGESVFDKPPGVVLGMYDQNMNRGNSNQQETYSGSSFYDVQPQYVIGMSPQNMNRGNSNQQKTYSGHSQCDILQSSCEIDWDVYNWILKNSNEFFAQDFVNQAIDFDCLLTLTLDDYLEIILFPSRERLQLWSKIRVLQEQFLPKMP